MVIDFHTHTFPEAMAARAVDGISRAGDLKYYSDGTVPGLRASMARAGVDMALLAPVVTKPHQTEGINRVAEEVNAHTAETGLVSLAGIHPDNEGIAGILDDIKKRGFPGIKLHPLFQGVPADDIRYLRIIDRAAELDLIVLIHAGSDPSYPGCDFGAPGRLLNVLRQIPHRRIVLAHMGGFAQWSEAEALWGCPVYLDTAVALGPWRRRDGQELREGDNLPMDPDTLVRAVRLHGSDRVLFGSDSPWSDQGEALGALRGSGLTEEELRMITCDNAKRLLGIG